MGPRIRRHRHAPTADSNPITAPTQTKIATASNWCALSPGERRPAPGLHHEQLFGRREQRPYHRPDEVGDDDRGRDDARRAHLAAHGSTGIRGHRVRLRIRSDHVLDYDRPPCPRP
ncbi:hypothetical protein [Nocardia cyriacigeorgica]|uniref:hypothetical protein n=1 Tax=Nocardia cyriacigeorgica TaxID=135487 RepID=UPI00031E0EEF|nr:hypothetical protein [Nocardia cyriacigeorgica]